MHKCAALLLRKISIQGIPSLARPHQELERPQRCRTLSFPCQMLDIDVLLCDVMHMFTLCLSPRGVYEKIMTNLSDSLYSSTLLNQCVYQF